MKKIATAFFIILSALALCGSGAFFSETSSAHDHTFGASGTAILCEAPGARTAEDGNDDDEGDIDKSVDDLIAKLDLKGIQSIVDSLSSDQLELFGFSDIVSRISAVASGEFETDYGGFFGYAAALLGADIFEFLPMLFGCLAIVVAYGIINSVKARAAGSSVERVVYFATGAIAITLIAGYFTSVTVSAVGFVSAVKSQINTVAPVIITLMTAAGASSTAGVYAPTVALLGSGMNNVITYLAFPALLMAVVFDIIGSIADGIKLTGAAEFFRSACKWLLGTAFFIFVTVMGISGITASVRDGISVRAARFAVSKYVPVIGGYLSQGFDFIMAGNVLIKNALGSSAVILIVLCALPVITKTAVFTLTLKLTAAVAEPLGGEKFTGVLTSVSKSASMMSAVVCAMTFLYVLFLSLTIGTGNMAL